MTASSLPEGIAVDPSGAFVSVVNDGENSMTLFSLASGALTAKFTAQTRTIPVFASFYGGVAAPVIGPSNVFAANSGSGNISGFIATPATGALAAGSGSPTAGQASTDALCSRRDRDVPLLEQLQCKGFRRICRCAVKRGTDRVYEWFVGVDATNTDIPSEFTDIRRVNANEPLVNSVSAAFDGATANPSKPLHWSCSSRGTSRSRRLQGSVLACPAVGERIQPRELR